MSNIFDCNVYYLFIIKNFSFNTPLNILNYNYDKMINNEYLTINLVSQCNYNVYFSNKNIINQNQRKWIIEYDENNYDYYIKHVFNSSPSYLGCPKNNNLVNLYTKGNFSKWIITALGNDIYAITYSGIKFNKNLIDIMTIKYKYYDKFEWLQPYDEIVTIYDYTDDIVDTNFKIIKIIDKSNVYLKHIYENYNNLSDYIFFLENKILNQNDDIIKIIDNYGKITNFQSLNKYFFDLYDNLTINASIFDNVKYLKQSKLLLNINNDNNFDNNVLITNNNFFLSSQCNDKIIKFYIELINIYKSYKNNFMDMLFSDNINIFMNDIYYVSSFVIKKDLIIKNKIDLYLKINNALNDAIYKYHDFIYNHLWFMLFNKEKKFYNKTLKKKLSVIIRGHVRDSFLNNKMDIFIKLLTIIYDVEIYIHSWNISEANSSHRKLLDNKFTIDENKILDYFINSKKYIKKIFIDDDTKINIIGNIDGKIGNTNMPIIAWKKMWFGIHKCCEYVYNSKIYYDGILNIRIDNFNVMCSTINKINDITNIINRLNLMLHSSCDNKIKLLSDKRVFGIDNCFIGNVSSIYKMTYNFVHNLDDIISKQKNINNQEFVFYDEVIEKIY